ncbi:MAG: L-carnitine dehydratase/bile acid-inducible protein F [uncultured Thermomicrobiales bacterium]|uniref:L-carnitine dehydratase/bile acid-inducible protein F n=1 Tax=uncultured Thermomicrobiales bacterium TaxID=1645740 RepID=A0A6J4VW86_9BACT|nr:MAG: L-carnitine dehydratase/bile acid-inducible protein F [uncultured Thermomicrobiales bacterium]
MLPPRPQPDPRAFAGGEQPLAGLRVLELGTLIAGPFATRLMAEFGARVIKVEAPGAADPLRTWRYVDPRTGTSIWWAVQARNKHLVTLDLKHPDGLALAKRLAAECDIIVENFRPGLLERLGLGWETLHALNPRLILVRVSGYGQTGPARDKPGFGSVGESLGGLRYVTGEPERPPVRPGISLGDSLAALYAVVGALIAVYARDVRGTGEGQIVDVALYEAVFSMMESMLPEYDLAGLVRERTGSALPGIAPSNTYRTGDEGYVVIGGNSDPIFRRLMAAIGQPALADNPRYRSNADRAAHAAELDTLIEDWTSERPAQEIVALLDGANVPVGLIYSVADIVDEPQYRAREMILDAEIAGIGTVKMPGLVPKLSATPGRVAWYGGEPGSHNREIYQGLLGIDDEEFARLAREGVI